jgi:hypothetical protein
MRSIHFSALDFLSLFILEWVFKRSALPARIVIGGLVFLINSAGETLIQTKRRENDETF